MVRLVPQVQAKTERHFALMALSVLLGNKSKALQSKVLLLLLLPLLLVLLCWLLLLPLWLILLP